MAERNTKAPSKQAKGKRAKGKTAAAAAAPKSARQPKARAEQPVSRVRRVRRGASVRR